MSSETVELEEKIIERAANERGEIISNAKIKASEMLNSAKQEAKRITAEGKDRAYRLLGADLKAVRDQILGEAELEGRRTLAESKEAILSHVFKLAEKRVIDIANGKDESIDCRDVLSRLIKEAALSVGEEELIIEANKSDREHLQSKLHNFQEQLSKALGYNVKLQIKKETLHCLGGVIVYDAAQRKIYYNTLEGRLLKFRSVLEASLTKNLFGG